ncbi:MAG: hypothetical protein MUF30_05445 [Burkholderiales bacterium]|nr:hypothetical protein [Burkholderiales bacterium]
MSSPRAEDLSPTVTAVTDALARDHPADVQRACQQLVDALVLRFQVPPVRMKVWPARPSGDWGELHGLYVPDNATPPARIELWMRTAQLRKVVAPRTFVRTFVHEFCHHLDYEHFGLAETFHTEGFYKRESHLLAQLAGPPAVRAKAQASASTTRTGTRGARAVSNS